MDRLIIVSRASTDIGVLKRSLILIACCFLFAMIMLFPRISEQPVPLRFGEVDADPDSGSRVDPHNPYPDYNSSSWRMTWRGLYRPCIGPDGEVLDYRNQETAMTGYRWNQSGL